MQDLLTEQTQPRKKHAGSGSFSGSCPDTGLLHPLNVLATTARLRRTVDNGSTISGSRLSVVDLIVGIDHVS